MKTVVCATRGGEACRRTQERAIQMAQEQEADLSFLYVADPHLMDPVDEGLAEALKGEISRLGRSLLRIAQNRANKAGQKAEVSVVYGPVQESIINFLRQEGATTLVLGAPRSKAVAREFSSKGIDDFAQIARQELDIEVEVV